MATYYIYLKPYMRADKIVYYCGYTNDPVRRDEEHNRETRYIWVGKLRVLDGFTMMDVPIASARAQEKLVKSKSSDWKHHFYCQHSKGGVFD